MTIFPAIDIKNGCCVRLQKGDFATVHKVANDATKTAMDFQNDGATWLHMVNLDASLHNGVDNSEIFSAVLKNTSLKIQLGGGINSMAKIEHYLSLGISRLVIGSAAVNNIEFTKEALLKYPAQIAIGIDAREENVATNGWKNSSAVNYIDLALLMEQLGAKKIIFTDIGCDGMLCGINLAQLAKLKSKVSCDIIASGGVSSIEDVKSAYQMGLYGVICGKALYSGSLSLAEALKYEVQ